MILRTLSSAADRLSEPPALTVRVLVSLAIALCGAALITLQYQNNPGIHTDFGMSWFGAKSILHGVDPYPLVGKGKEFDYSWPLTYPGPSLVALLPFGLLSEKVAAIIFVGLSTFLLAFGVTRRSLYLLPLFATEPFVNAARLGQWNILLAAALFFPWALIFFPVKPQTAIPVLACSTKKSSWIFAVAGSVALLTLSLVLLPNWIPEWLTSVRQMPDTSPPVTRLGGFLILAALLRWRRPEAWLILALACVPQTPAFYSLLPLLTVADSFVEAVVLAACVTAGGYVGASLIPASIGSLDALNAYSGSLHVFTVFLPSVVMILRRPNIGEPPAWIVFLRRAIERVTREATLATRRTDPPSRISRTNP